MSMRDGKDQHVSAEDADQRMDSAGEIPFSNEEIAAMVRSATRDGTPPPRKLRLMPHYGVWNKLAALLLAAAILFGLLLMMSGMSQTLISPAVPTMWDFGTAGIHAHPLRALRNGHSDPNANPNGSQPAPWESTPANSFPGQPTEQP